VQPNRGVNILIVDDDQTQALMLATFLSKHGYHCFTSPDPVAAMQALMKEEIHLVITDLMMPHVDGISFTQQIHAVPRFKDLPVILITAYPSEELSDKGMRKGVAMTLHKPLELNKLLDLVGFATH
jgi:two-component system, chemotaxis family, chemotaxis protein CheY